MKTRLYSISLKTILGLSFLFNAVLPSHAQVPQLSGYCPNNPTPGVPTFNQTCGSATHWSYIQSVETTGGMVNFSNLNTNCGNTTTSYSDYTGTNMLVRQNAGQSVDVKITWRGSCTNPTFVCSALEKIFVDWNRDGVFDPVDEHVKPIFTPPATSPHIHPSAGTITIKVTVPGNAKEGLTRMRIISSANITYTSTPPAQLQPCSGVFGEAEDYTFEVVNPCLPPNVISIANKDFKSADFSWTPKENAEFYEYVITPVDTIPHDTVSGFTFTTGTSVDVDTFECDTKYYVMVRVVCDTAGKIARDWKRSSWRRDSVVTEPCCYAPSLKFDKLTHNSVRVMWEPVQTAYGYEYAVSTTPNPPQKGHYTISTAVVQQGMSPKTTYFFHVRSRCTPTPLSDWSKVSFKTFGGVSVENVQGGASFSIEAYPNPMQNNLTVLLNGSIGTNAHLAIIDLTGKAVYSAPVKADKVVIDAANLPPGIYIVKYNDDTHNEIMRVTKK